MNDLEHRLECAPAITNEGAGTAYSDDWSPLAKVIDEILDECRQHRIRGDVLASTFPCA